MTDCKLITTPMVSNLKNLRETTYGIDPVDLKLYKQLIVSLLYLVHTRPDICFVVSTLSQFMSDLRHVHWVASKHVLRYLSGMIGYGLRYTSIGGVKLSGYTDSDWVGSAVDQKSTSGYCFSMGSAMISQSRRKQIIVALSTAEPKYIVASDAGKEAIWLRNLLAYLFGDVLERQLSSVITKAM